MKDNLVIFIFDFFHINKKQETNVFVFLCLTLSVFLSERLRLEKIYRSLIYRNCYNVWLDKSRAYMRLLEGYINSRILIAHGDSKTMSVQKQTWIIRLSQKSMALSYVIQNIHRCRIFLSSAFMFARRVAIQSIDSNYIWEICKSASDTNEHVRSYGVSVCQNMSK